MTSTIDLKGQTNLNLPAISEKLGIDHSETYVQGKVWYVEDVDQKTLEEAVAAFDHVARAKEIPVLEVGRKRAVNYPPIGDQLDAIWKELSARKAGGDTLVSDADSMLGKIQAVKKKHPKPE